MRALKTILIIVFALAVILLILGLTGPKTTEVKRSVLVDARPETIYPMIANLKRSHEWEPWKDMEKDVKGEWSEQDGVVGAYTAWEGDTLGKGRNEITALEENKSVTSRMEMYEPWSSVSEVQLLLTPEQEATRVDWILTQKNEGMGRLFAVFMDMDKMVGPEFQLGLENLKAQAEAIEKEQAGSNVGGYSISSVQRPAITYVGKRSVLKWDEMEGFFGATFGGAYGAVAAQGLAMNGYPSGIFFEWNEEEKTADLMAGIPVKGDSTVQVNGFETYTVPASKMLHIAYYGAYDKSGEAHMAMSQKIEADGLVHYGNVIEEYVTDPGQEPDTAKWLTNIYYMVR